MKHNTINRWAFYLKNKILRRKIYNRYLEAMANQELTPDELKKRCWEKQVAIVKYAYENCPYYKALYDKHGFNPNDLISEEDWDKIPVLEKSAIRDSYDELIAKNIPNGVLSFTTTGGSTGLPLKVGKDRRFRLEIIAWRFFNWWGISYADNTAITHRRVPSTFKERLMNALLWWPTKRVYLSATSMTEIEISQFVQKLNTKKIVWITGYAGALETVADYILKKGIKIKHLKMVWSTSAPLSDIARTKMEHAYRCKVMNQYGCCEVAHIATQCPQSEHMHINSDFVHVDVVDEDNRCVIEQEGDILVTDLYNFAFPLIKYRLGDKGCLLKEKCSCGLPFPLMKSVKGRISDAIYTPSGIYVDGNYMTTIFDNYSEYIDQFQVYQKSDYSVEIRIKEKMTAPEDLDVVLDSIKKKISADTHNEVPVDVVRVKGISHDKGKIRYIISEIALKKLK